VYERNVKAYSRQETIDDRRQTKRRKKTEIKEQRANTREQKTES
jgi:hypothetical protein